MKNNKQYIQRAFFLAATCFLALHSQSQDSSPILKKAMKDELERNMKELTYKEYQRPFYISYTLSDAYNVYASATLGALVSSSENHFRDWSLRVMAGGYELNDENFSDMNSTLPYGDGNIDLPIENDYFGIRRTFWISTNNTYKRAAENYNNKITALKQKSLSAKDLEIPDFCHVPVVKIDIPSTKPDVTKPIFENKVREVSAVFKNYSDITYSKVSILQFYTDIYFINSEGIETKSPLHIISLVVYVQSITDDSDIIPNQLTYYALTLDGLPSVEKIKEDAKKMAENLLALRKASRFSDSYSGPVLIQGQVVAEIFASTLFSGLNSLIAFREPLYNSTDMTMFYGQNTNPMESKIDKKIISKDISIVAEPMLKTYQGTSLIGFFQVDAEGVVPPEKLILVEDGVLKTLLNGRTPTRAVKGSNGHNRFSIWEGGVSKNIGPGVVTISGANGKTIAELKQMLIERAKEEGLNYAIIIKPLDTYSSCAPINIYRVSVEDGSEELLRAVDFKEITTNSLKKIMGISNHQIIFNTMTGNGSNGFDLSALSASGSLASGLPASFIVPDGLLIEEIEMEGKQKLISGDLPIVKNPVGDK